MSEKKEENLRANTEVRNGSVTNPLTEKTIKSTEIHRESVTNPLTEKTIKSTEIHRESVIKWPVEKIYREYIIPHEVHWVPLQNLNDVIVGNYFSMILFGLSTALFGAWLTSTDETQKFFCGFFCLILFIISVILQYIFVLSKIHKWKKKAIKGGDSK